jgi:hypothetical protein
MLISRNARRHPTAQSSAPPTLDARFPCAVRGEDYPRYAAAMWGQAVRWLRREIARTAEDVTQDAYTVLQAAAEGCVERDLYPQEEQLLSALVLREWDAIVAERVRFSPEIPTFLRSPK